MSCLLRMIYYLIVFVFSCFIISRLTIGKCRSARCLVGKTAVITGGNSGIGYQTALDLASRGCRVIIAARNNLEEAKDKIIKTSGNPNIICKKLDLSSFKSIREFAKEINVTESKIDILIHNSGIPSATDEETEDGNNRVIQVNYLAPFLLTHLLLDKLKQSAPSRIIFTSSILAFCSTMNLDNIKSSKNIAGSCKSAKLYIDTKLASIMAADCLAKGLTGSGVTSNSLHPGWVRTDIFQKWSDVEAEGSMRFLNWIMRIFAPIVAKDVWEGAQTTIYAAVSEELDNVTGMYFIDCKKFWKPFLATNKDLADKLWHLSEDLVGLSPDERLPI